MALGDSELALYENSVSEGMKFLQRGWADVGRRWFVAIVKSVTCSTGKHLVGAILVPKGWDRQAGTNIPWYNMVDCHLQPIFVGCGEIQFTICAARLAGHLNEEATVSTPASFSRSWAKKYLAGPGIGFERLHSKSPEPPAPVANCPNPAPSVALSSCPAAFITGCRGNPHDRTK